MDACTIPYGTLQARRWSQRPALPCAPPVNSRLRASRPLSGSTPGVLRQAACQGCSAVMRCRPRSLLCIAAASSAGR